MTATVEQYKNAVFKLNPSGFVMPTPPDDSNYGTLVEVISKAVYDAQFAADSNLDEIFPDVVGSYIEDWQRITQTPPCDLLDLTSQQKRDIVVAWLNMSEFSNEQFFIDIAALIGYTITISYPIADNFHWQVNASSQTAVIFKAGQSLSGERLVSYGNGPLECIINFFKPAHTVVNFDYT